MPMRFFSPRLALIALTLTAAAACRSENRDRPADSAVVAVGPSAAGTAANDSARPGTSGTAKGMGGMHKDTLAPKVEVHLQRLATTNADSLRALVAADRDVVTTLIADCEQMMRAMKMDLPRKWRNAVHELRQDLDRMASMTGAQLQQTMPDHRRRIEAMLAMRRDMMRM